MLKRRNMKRRMSMRCKRDEVLQTAARFAIVRDVENIWYRCYQIAIVIDSVHRSLVGHRYGQQNAVTAENMYKEAAGALGESLPRS